MTNKEAIERLRHIRVYDIYPKSASEETKQSLDLAVKALEKDKCSSCKHYDKDYGETCLNPEGTCRVFYYERYEEAKE